MDAEHEKGIQRLEQESSRWEYCVLTWNPHWEDGIMSYKVNKRHKVDVAGMGEIQTEIRKAKRKPETDPFYSYYEDKFMERWRETGGFGPFDAIDVLAKDSWEIATSVSSPDSNRLYIIFKRQKSPESLTQTE